MPEPALSCPPQLAGGCSCPQVPTLCLGPASVANTGIWLQSLVTANLLSWRAAREPRWREWGAGERRKPPTAWTPCARGRPRGGPVLAAESHLPKSHTASVLTTHTTSPWERVAVLGEYSTRGAKGWVRPEKPGYRGNPHPRTATRSLTVHKLASLGSGLCTASPAHCLPACAGKAGSAGTGSKISPPGLAARCGPGPVAAWEAEAGRPLNFQVTWEVEAGGLPEL